MQDDNHIDNLVSISLTTAATVFKDRKSALIHLKMFSTNITLKMIFQN